MKQQVLRIQAVWRSHAVRQVFIKQLRALRKVQSRFRAQRAAKSVRLAFCRLKAAAIVLQRVMRRQFLRNHDAREARAAVRIQKNWKRHAAQATLRYAVYNATRIQAFRRPI